MSDCRGIRERLGRYLTGKLHPPRRRSVGQSSRAMQPMQSEPRGNSEISGIFREGMAAPPARFDLTQKIMEERRHRSTARFPAGTSFCSGGIGHYRCDWQLWALLLWPVISAFLSAALH